MVGVLSLSLAQTCLDRGLGGRGASVTSAVCPSVSARGRFVTEACPSGAGRVLVSVDTCLPVCYPHIFVVYVENNWQVFGSAVF